MKALPVALASLLALAAPAQSPGETNAVLNISGTYPHLAVFSDEGEIGIGAVVPWAGKLWFNTYPPHFPNGSADRLWTVDSNLTLTARPESVGGTHANRFIHRESGQLIIGPHFIDARGTVRTIPPTVMQGRLTANARHLVDPTNRVYFVTMEKGIYDVDVNTMAVRTLYRDGHNTHTNLPAAPFPGTHGKGAYTGQGRLICANNGEAGWTIRNDPELNAAAGVLAEHTGANWSAPWTIVERKNFTEVTGPGGVQGNARTEDPVWATGWDKRSVLLKVLDAGVWHTRRLPKGSYSHDAIHGWYTEWPRIREITPGKTLMHMHGLFYDFPQSFSAAHTEGLRPICTYLKMPVDYCWWNGQLIISRDDASPTGGNKWCGQANSSLWFGQLTDLEQWGAPAGFGGPWKDDAVMAGQPSDWFLVAGFKQRVLHLKHTGDATVDFAVQFAAPADGSPHLLTHLKLGPKGYAWYLFSPSFSSSWVRLMPDRATTGVTAYFQLANPPTPPAPARFAGIPEAPAPGPLSDGILRARDGDARVLQFATQIEGGAAAYYEIGDAFQLRRTTNAAAEKTLRTDYSLAQPDFTVDAASLVYTEGTRRFRLPKSSSAYDTPFASGWPRGIREVVTERNLLNAHGTFYELPRLDSGGARRIRPVATHRRHISDFASWRGLFVISGVADAAPNDGHVFRSDDGKAALWFGNVDDLWRLGPPSGTGGPWKDTAVAANVPSDPYLMLGYQHKTLELFHQSAQPVTFILEVDFAADDTWAEYARYTVAPGRPFQHEFPAGYSAHWVRLIPTSSTTATATFTYK